MVPLHTLEKMKQISRNSEIHVFYAASEICVMAIAYEVPEKQTTSKALADKLHRNVRFRILDEYEQFGH
jgi:homoserine kinase